MPHAYTPGLTITPRTRLRKRRLLPMEGEVLVEKGDRVDAETVVARAELPGDIHPINVVGRLGIRASDIHEYMLKEEGEEAEEQEPIAETNPWLSILKTVCRAPVKGKIENVSEVTGQVMLREPPKRIDLKAYMRGEVVEVLPGEGVVVEATAAMVQGIFGISGECTGTLRVLVENPGDELDPSELDESCKDCIVVCGCVVTSDLVDAARRVGAKALVAGGMSAAELRKVVGCDIGVAVTGTEPVGVTVILTEGFSRLDIAENTFKLLKSLEGREASANGTTQIRAGVQRPEVVVPAPADEAVEDEFQHETGGLHEGDRIRVIRAPYFGLTGTVTELVRDAVKVESEATVRVLKMESDDGRILTVPRANTEIIGRQGGM